MLLGPIGFACPFLLGLWAGRRRILERPEAHRRMLGVVAVVGIAAAVLGAQPVSLVLAGAVPLPGEDAFAQARALHAATGVLGGAGFAAAIALLSLRLAGSPGRVVRALAATGQRSLTCYLAQSVVWAIVFTPFLLGLAGRLTVATTAAAGDRDLAGDGRARRRAGAGGPARAVRGAAAPRDLRRAGAYGAASTWNDAISPRIRAGASPVNSV